MIRDKFVDLILEHCSPTPNGDIAGEEILAEYDRLTAELERLTIENNRLRYDKDELEEDLAAIRAAEEK